MACSLFSSSLPGLPACNASHVSKLQSVFKQLLVRPGRLVNTQFALPAQSTTLNSAVTQRSAVTQQGRCSGPCAGPQLGEQWLAGPGRLSHSHMSNTRR